MTDPTVLADALVEAGIGYCNAGAYKFYVGESLMPAHKFITDGRVVMKVLELVTGKPNWYQITFDRKCSSVPVARVWIYDIEGEVIAHKRGDDLERTIIEAWYEARQ